MISNNNFKISETRGLTPMKHDFSYYLKCMMGGVLSCGLTHTAVVPLDVTKCKAQVYPMKYPSLLPGMKKIIAEEGFLGLTRGWAPTFWGYSAQGLFKFGFYEMFKDVYGSFISPEYKGATWLAASASAEVFADIALCPFEMIKIKMQTSQTWPKKFYPAASQMISQKNETRFPFGSLKPLWSRQIPYTMAKFFFYERTVQYIYENILTKKPKDEYSKGTQLMVTFCSGYIAGIICAIVSHPADNMVSQLGKASNKGKGFYQIAKDVGIKNMCTKGLGTRIIMLGTLTASQWWIYDLFKTSMGMETTGGGVVHHNK